MTPNERSLRARLAAHTLHAKGGTNTEPAREAFLERFEREIREAHPELSDAEVARRAEHSRKAHMTRLALKSAQARRKARGGAS